MKPVMAPRSQRPRLRTCSAFTLIELVFVLAIVATLAAISAPRYSTSMSNYRAEAAAQRVRADLLLAASSARTTGSSRTITFSPAADTYSLTDLTANDRSGNNYLVELTKAPYSADLVSATFESGAAVVFNGFGLPDVSGQIVLQSGGVQKIITLDAATGEVTIE
jgi:prepilin-type N-terminal cleavage/methylation domain-containing protein